MDDQTTIAELKLKVAAFRDKRDWKQFHTPKNLSMAIAVEAAELMNHFKWTEEPQSLGEVVMELADVVIYCLNLSNTLNVDLSDAILEKLERNNSKYRVGKFRGKWKA